MLILQQFNPIIVATQFVVATWIFSSKSDSTLDKNSTTLKVDLPIKGIENKH